MTNDIQAAARGALWAFGGNHPALADHFESYVGQRWPGQNRAFFVETEENGRGVQVYQPYGMPRVDHCPARNGSHTYSRAINQPRPRRCVNCGAEEQ